MLTITPSRTTYRIGDTVTVDADSAGTLAVEGDTLQLVMFADATGTFSDVLASVTADASGNAGFADFVIPADIGAGADRRFLVRHSHSGLQDFSDPFTLLPAASAPARLSLGLGMGL